MSNQPTNTTMPHAAYPEVYYQLQPIISRICNEMDDLRYSYPLQEQYNCMREKAYDDVCQMHPQYCAEENEGDAQETISRHHENRHGGHGGDRHFDFRRHPRFRHHRNLIDMILMDELLRRRRKLY